MPPTPDKAITVETEVVIASATTVVAMVGTQPIPWFLDLNRDGIPDWQQKPVRDAIATGLYWLVGRVFPGAAQSLALKQLEPAITTLIEAGSK